MNNKKTNSFLAFSSRDKIISTRNLVHPPLTRGRIIQRSHPSRHDWPFDFPLLSSSHPAAAIHLTTPQTARQVLQVPRSGWLLQNPSDFLRIPLALGARLRGPHQLMEELRLNRLVQRMKKDNRIFPRSAISVMVNCQSHPKNAMEIRAGISATSLKGCL